MAGWLTPAQVAEQVGVHVVTVWRALERGELHGHQRCPGGRWLVHTDAPVLWVTGRDSRDPCGCARIIPLKRKRSA